MSITREDALSLFYEVVRLSGQYAKSHSSAPACWAGQARCLALLEGSGPISQKRLAEILQIRPLSERACGQAGAEGPDLPGAAAGG